MLQQHLLLDTLDGFVRGIGLGSGIVAQHAGTEQMFNRYGHCAYYLVAEEDGVYGVFGVSVCSQRLHFVLAYSIVDCHGISTDNRRCVGESGMLIEQSHSLRSLASGSHDLLSMQLIVCSSRAW